MLLVLLSGATAMVLSLAGTRWAIGWFLRNGLGQPIRQDGPTTHIVKQGTPTMGGVAIILSATVAYLAVTFLTGRPPTASGWLLLLVFVGCGLVGFLDDFIKVYLKRNLGLRSGQKMLGQTAVALTFGVLAVCFFPDGRGVHPASRFLSTVEDWGPRLPLVVVLLFLWFIITGASNGANLADGMDGLLAGISAMIFGAYTMVNIGQNNRRCGFVESLQCYDVRDPLDLAIVSAGITGACIGFLWWNASPARIFMGDVGSLALGGALAGLAIMTRTEVLMAVIGGVFVLETVSVMIQVSVFKWTRIRTGTGRRVFLITPIHSHFEMLGWSEVSVVLRFWIMSGLCIGAGLGIFYLV